MAVGVADADAERGAVAECGADVGAFDRVGVGVVDAGALRVELAAEGVVIEATTSAGEGGISVRSGEVAAVSAKAEFGDAKVLPVRVQT